MGGVGGQDRVEAVYRAVHSRLWRSLLAFTGDAELASDAEAEAFAQVLRRGDAVDDVAAWVWRSAFRIASGLLAASSSAADPGAVALDGWVGSSGSVAEFMGLLADLSSQQRACVALRYVGEYTATEIGELLGTSAGTVRVQLSRAHAALRDSITEAKHA
jgi:DNA-directed RNA polymerase specialized sigma24 family protein